MAQMDSSTTQFEDAFDEFYIQSPQPKFAKPMFAPRGKSRLAAPRKGVKVKAIFDMMKERNSSICSESDLNSSVLTSNASFCEADLRTTTDRNGTLRAKEKTGTPEKAHDETDHLSERSTPRTHRPPPEVQSPALRIGLNFVQHAARVDGSDSFSSTSTADKENQDTRPAPVVSIIDKTGRAPSSLSHRGLGSRQNAAKSLYQQGSKTVTSAIRNHEKDSENVSEICSSVDPVFCKVTDSRRTCHSDRTDSRNKNDNLIVPDTRKVCQNDNLPVPSASSSPGNHVSNESSADQETLQLVSKLVQRLQSSAVENDESDWELASLPRKHGLGDNNAQLANRTQSSHIAKRLQGRSKTQCAGNSQSLAKRPQGRPQTQCADNSPSSDVAKGVRGRPQTECADNNSQSSNAVNRPQGRPQSQCADNSESSDVAKGAIDRPQTQCADINSQSSNAVKRPRRRPKAQAINKAVITSDNLTISNNRTKINAGNKFPIGENDEEKLTAQISTNRTFQKSTKAPKQRTVETCSRTLRTRKNGRTVPQGSSEVGEKKNGAIRKEPAVKLGQKNLADYHHDTVEADIITQRRANQVLITKDPFSLDSTLEEEQLHVEEDAITIASKSKKSNISKAARKKTRTTRGVTSVSQAVSGNVDIGVTDAEPSTLGDEPADGTINTNVYTIVKRANNAASTKAIKSTKQGKTITYNNNAKTTTERETTASTTDKTARGGVTELGADKTMTRDGSTAFKASKSTSRADLTAAKAKNDKSKILKVSSWSLQPVARLKGVRIEGKLPNTDYFWLSSVIVERVSSRILKSTNGSLYQLMGNISVLNTRAAGFSQEIVQLFRRGFPVDWRELLESSITAAESNCQTGHTDIVPTPFKGRLQQANQKPNGTVVAAQPQTPLTKPKKTVDASSFHTPTITKKHVDDDYTIWTPKGIVSRTLEANAVRRTQSGRCVIPPLARWAGQFLKQDQDGNVTIGFASQVAEKHFAQIAEQIHAPKRLMKSPAQTGRRTHVKKLMKDISSPGPTEVTDSVTTNKPEKPRKTTSNKALKSKPGRKTVKRDEGPVSAKDANLRVESLEEDVMSLVQKSKQKRLQNMARKKTNLCYSNAAVEWNNIQEERLSESDGNSEEDDPVSERNTESKSSKTVNATFITSSHANLDEKISKGTVPKGKQSKKAVLQAGTELVQSQNKGKNRAARNQKKNRKPSGEDEDVENHTSSENKTHSQPSKKQNRQKKKPKPIIEDDSDEDNFFNEKESDDDETSDQLFTAKSRQRSRASKQKKKVIVDDSDDDSCDEKSSNDDDDEDAYKHFITTNRQQAKQKKITKPVYDDSLEDFCDETNPQTNVTVKKNAKKLTQEKKSKKGNKRNVDDTGPQTNMTVQKNAKTLTQEKTSRKGNKRNIDGKGTASKPEHSKDAQPAMVKKAKRPGQKGRGQKAKDVDAGPLPKETIPSSEDAENSQAWTPEEIEKLQRGLQTISSDHPDYWGAVSHYVGTRSPTQCAAFHLTEDKLDQGPAAHPKPCAKATEPNKDAKTPSLKGKRGTLKRRQAIRAILEHDGNNNTQDDLFQATPFRTKKRAKIAAVDFSKTDEEVFGRNPNFFTPRADGSQPVGVLFGCTPASSKKTPSLHITNSPWQQKDSAQKRDVDQYLFRMQKNKRQLTKSFNKKKKACEDKDGGASCTTALSLFHPSPAPAGLFQIREEEPGDEEEMQDYYFSEDDN